jgi:PAS domain S-box-containing protein
MLNSIAELIESVGPPKDGCGVGEKAALKARVDQLTAELSALWISRAEAVSRALEEHEKRIVQQEEHVHQLQKVMMRAADGFITFDAHGTIESFNEAAGRIFGCTSEEAIGRNIGTFIAAVAEEGSEEFSARCFPPGLRQEMIGRRNDGSMFPLDVAVSEVELHPRRIYTGICRDITDRKRAEEELRRLHLQNEMILNSAGEGIVGLDQNGILIFANPAAARMLGWDVSDATGRIVSEVLHACPRPLERHGCDGCLAHQALHGGATCLSGNEVFCRKDGTKFPVEYTWRRTAAELGPVGGVLTFRDITERRWLEAQLRQAQKLESIGQLAAGIAHEINTPAQFIGDNLRFLQDGFKEIQGALTGLLQLCRETDGGPVQPQTLAALRDVVQQADLGYLIEEIPKAVTQSRNGVERVTRILRSMREFSHPGGDQFQAIDLNQAIDSTLTVARNEYKYVADVVTEFDCELPPVHCLPGDLNQVFLNLIVNAGHAIGDRLGKNSTNKGTITITTCHDHDWAEIRVQDTGTGIPEAIRTRVYDHFFTTKEVGRGTGQGLAITHAIIVEKHQGTIHFETETGVGTTFIVRLPLHRKTAAGEASA